MSFRCCSFLLHQIVVDILVVGISEGLVRHPVLEYIADTLNRLASCLVVVEEAMDVGVTVKVILTMGILTFSPQAFRVPSIRFVPAHPTPRYPVLRPGEDIIREKQQNVVLINTISFRARDVDSELVYRNG